MFRTKDQNKRLHLLLTANGIDRTTTEGKEILEDMVYKASNGRVKESSRLLIPECQALINNLNAMKNQRVTVSGNNPIPENTPANKMRRKILSICREMGKDWYNNGYNWDKINAWLLKYGYLHKGLNAYTEAELPKLVTQFDNLLQSEYAKR